MAKPGKLMSILDEKEHLESRRDIYHRHGNFELVDITDMNYDDEYDDTYDGLIGAGDDDNADDMMSRR